MHHAARKGLMAQSAALFSLPLYAAERNEVPPPEGPVVPLCDVPATIPSIVLEQLEIKPTSAKTVTFDGWFAYLRECTNTYSRHPTVVVAADGTVLKPVSIWAPMTADRSSAASRGHWNGELAAQPAVVRI